MDLLASLPSDHCRQGYVWHRDNDTRYRTLQGPRHQLVLRLALLGVIQRSMLDPITGAYASAKPADYSGGRAGLFPPPPLFAFTQHPSHSSLATSSVSSLFRRLWHCHGARAASLRHPKHCGVCSCGLCPDWVDRLMHCHVLQSMRSGTGQEPPAILWS